MVFHISPFLTRDNLPVCERLYFMQARQKLIIQSTLEEQEITSRKRVKLTVNSADESKKIGACRYLCFGLPRGFLSSQTQSEAIDSYLWLTSDLRAL